jgi:hypothetical protein
MSHGKGVIIGMDAPLGQIPPLLRNEAESQGSEFLKKGMSPAGRKE